MKEFEADKSEANDATETSSEDAEDIDEEAHDEELEEGDDDDADEEDHSDDDDDDGEESEGDDDDDIDIGSHIGLVFDDEEVYGKIVEFDDDEGTVTIEEDGTGDLVTGYQEDMFIE
jgi:hypothetical protein